MKNNFKMRFRDGKLLALIALGSLLLSSSLFTAGTAHTAAVSLPVIADSTTYTTDADFAGGTLFNVNNSAPNSNQLQLNTQLSTFPTMWIANTAAGESTVSKIDTVTGKELARYRTHFNSGYPSRTAVDRDGNVYIANRTFANRPMEVIKILASGGIDRNANGVIDTSADINNNNRTTLNGGIDPSEVLPLTDLNGNNTVDDNEIRDERIAWVARVATAATYNMGRSLSLDTQGNLWLGEFQGQRYWKLSSVNGSILGGPFSVAGNNPYGSAVDRNGILWGASLGSTLLRLDTNNANPTPGNGGVQVLNHGAFGQDYGIALGNNKVYQASLSSRNFIQYDPATGIFSNPGFPARQIYSTGIAVDSAGNIFTGRSNNGILKWSPAGAVLCENGVQPGASGQHGVIVDSNNDVWLINLSNNTVSKYRGSDCGFLGVFPVGQSPYTYSDATGITAFNNTIGSGKWSVIQDGGAAGTEWGNVVWNAEAQGVVPSGASIIVAARTAETQAGLGAQNFTNVGNNVPFAMTGRFIEVQATLNANATNQSPVLSDITITEIESAAATTSLLTSNTASIYGDNIVLTATVSSGSGTPAGTVEFFQGATSLGTSPLVAGVATKSIPTLDVGSYPISSAYGGNDDFLGSNGAAVHVVDKAPSTVTVTCTAGAPYTFNGSAQTPCTAEANGVLLSAIDVSASLVYGDNTNAGAATASANWGGDLNHLSSVGNGGFTIGQLSATWTTSPSTKIFGNPDPSPLTTGSGSGFLPADGVTATYGRAVGETVGSYAITATLSSAGGPLSNYNITNAGAAFTITAWTLNGFYQPVGIPNTYTVLNPPVIIWNTIRAGQTVPLKFNIFAGTVEKFTVAAIMSFTTQEVNCSTAASAGEDPVEVVTTGGTSLRYSGSPGSDGQFIQNWQTPSGANRCYRTVMTAADGSKLVAFFKTKK